MSERELKNLPIGQILSGPNPSREVFEDIDSLASTIQRHGLIQPIIVKKNIQKGYEIICGERRLQACKKAKLRIVPCIILNGNLTREQILEMQLVENIHRADLKVYEEIKLIESLKNNFNLTHDEIAVKTGLSVATVRNYLAISKLPEETVRKIEKDSHNPTHLTITKALILVSSKLPADKVGDTVKLIEMKGLSRKQLTRKLAQDQPNKLKRVKGSRYFWNELVRNLKDYHRYWKDYAELKEWETVDSFHLQINVTLPKDLEEVK